MQKSLYVASLSQDMAELSHIKYARRSSLPVRQNYLWRIETGVVRAITWLEDGTVVTLGVWGQGDVVGRALSKVEPYQLDCLSSVEVTQMELEELHRSPTILLNHIQQTENFLVIRSARKVEDMLIKLLGWLADRFGYEVDQGRAIDLKITHQDMAEMLGTTRVTVTRILKQFEEQGIIQRLTRQIVLKQEEFWYYEI
ncbi:MAG TPA: Crp/Fnr family transcriptional regulator [Thermosynechococcaceae cyanobacterium]